MVAQPDVLVQCINVLPAGPGYDPKQKGLYERTETVPVFLYSAKIATSSGASYLVLPHY